MKNKSSLFAAAALAALMLCSCDYSGSSNTGSSYDIGDIGQEIGNAVQDKIDKTVDDAANKLSLTYLGSNKIIADLAEILKSDKIQPSIKESRYYNGLCEIVRSDSIEIVYDNTAIGHKGLSFYLADGSCLETDSGIVFEPVSQTLDTTLFKYLLDNRNKKYMIIDAFNLSGLSEDYSTVLNETLIALENDSSYLYPFVLPLEKEYVGSGTVTINDITYAYDEFTYSDKVYYTDDGRFFIGTPSASSAVYISSSTSCPISLPDDYASVTIDDFKK
ncbi:MAG: hypothetical protein ACI4RG_03395 [Huintestinicola sp.]